MHRREFHKEDSVLREAGAVLGALWPFPNERPGSAPPTLIRCSQRAMATIFEVILPFGQPRATELAASAFGLIEELEQQLSVFRDDSEISALNQKASREDVAVEGQLFELLETAARLHRETSGAFDVTAGPLTKAWGFFHRQGRMPTPIERDAARRRVGMQHVLLNPANQSVRFGRDGVELNLGSIGKGYALDRAAQLLRRQGCRDFLLHAGGSSVIACGMQPGEARGWPVQIRHPWLEQHSLGTVYLRDQGLGTSAATYQHFEYNNRKIGHLLDPRTGRPAEGVASASALAPTAAEADALATAFYALGVDKTRLYCQSHPTIGAILLPEAPQSKVVAFGVHPEESTAVAGVLS